jgi:outer membrane protein TolC
MVPGSQRRVAALLGLWLALAGCQSVRIASRELSRPEHPAASRSPAEAKPRSTETLRPAAHDEDESAGEDTVEFATAEEPDLEELPGTATMDSDADESAATQSIDLTTALLLTSGENPQVAFAQARIEESLAQLERAKVLWLPSIRGGVNYNRHSGNIQDVAGTIIRTDRSSYFTGLGANAVGAGSPLIPGLLAQFHLTDAVFQPRIARQTICARQSGAQATINDELLETAIAYVNLLRAAQELAVAVDIEAKAQELERVTGEFSRTGAGLKSDHDRARTELALRTNDVHRGEEAVVVASARLAEQVRWDSSRQLVPLEPQLTPIELVPVGMPPQELIALALTQRPEVAESRHLVGEAIERLQRERYAPLIPSVLLGFSYGGLGGGILGNIGKFNDRVDADAVAYWEIRQLGLGERAVRHEAATRIQQSQQREIALLDRVAREVVEAHVQVSSRSQQIATTETAVAAAEESFLDNWERIQNGQGLPIEVLQSLQALALARREYVRVLADYNTAQFTLHRSLGWPIQLPR